MQTYLDLPSDLGGDVTIYLPWGVNEIYCDERELVEVNGGILTLSCHQPVRRVQYIARLVGWRHAGFAMLTLNRNCSTGMWETGVVGQN